MQRGSLDLMKKMNQKIILKIIHDEKSVSRAQISEIANLAPSTVTTIVKELINTCLVKESRKGKSRGGRRPILLELNKKGFYVCGFEWGVAEIKSVLLNMNREIVASKRIPVKDNNIDFFIDKTKSIIDMYIDKIENPDKIFGVGLGTHGMVNVEEGRLLFAPYFHWENIPIKNMLESIFDYNFLIDNDVRMMSYAEKWNGHQEFIFIYSGYGIGSAIVLNNQVYYGENWSAGEFGHMKIVENGPRCICGSYGCLNSLISLPELIKRYNPDFDKNGSFSSIRDEWDRIIKRARFGEEGALDIMEKTGKYLGIGISNVINFINPEAIIIGGDFLEAEDILFPIVERHINENTLKTCRKNIKITASSYGDLVGAIGAATKVLEQIFTFENR